MASYKPKENQSKDATDYKAYYESQGAIPKRRNIPYSQKRYYMPPNSSWWSSEHYASKTGHTTMKDASGKYYGPTPQDSSGHSAMSYTGTASSTEASGASCDPVTDIVHPQPFRISEGNQNLRRTSFSDDNLAFPLYNADSPSLKGAGDTAMNDDIDKAFDHVDLTSWEFLGEGSGSSRNAFDDQTPLSLDKSTSDFEKEAADVSMEDVTEKFSDLVGFTEQDFDGNQCHANDDAKTVANDDNQQKENDKDFSSLLDEAATTSEDSKLELEEDTAAHWFSKLLGTAALSFLDEIKQEGDRIKKKASKRANKPTSVQVGDDTPMETSAQKNCGNADLPNSDICGDSQHKPTEAATQENRGNASSSATDTTDTIKAVDSHGSNVTPDDRSFSPEAESSVSLSDSEEDDRYYVISSDDEIENCQDTPRGHHMSDSAWSKIMASHHAMRVHYETNKRVLDKKLRSLDEAVDSCELLIAEADLYSMDKIWMIQYVNEVLNYTAVLVYNAKRTVAEIRVEMGKTLPDALHPRDRWKLQDLFDENTIEFNSFLKYVVFFAKYVNEKCASLLSTIEKNLDKFRKS